MYDFIFWLWLSVHIVPTVFFYNQVKILMVEGLWEVAGKMILMIIFILINIIVLLNLKIQGGDACVMCLG